MNIRVSVHAVLIDPHTDAQVVILKPLQRKALLPIWVGASEANAIRLAMENIRVPRPLTHDLLKEFLTSLNVQLEKVIIRDVHRNTYYASLYFTRIFFETSPTTFSGDGMESFELRQKQGDRAKEGGVSMTSFQMDARPSDAIILSLRYGSPLYVNKDVLNQQDVNAELAEWLTHIRQKQSEADS